jgi:acetylornithine deacetylase/succinyl-diaminopimelate desuccinylase-like protein
MGPRSRGSPRVPDAGRSLADILEASIDEGRLVDRALNLLEIPSFSGDEGAVADAYAAMLTAAGLEVEIDRTFYASPSVIARTREVDRSDGPVLQLAGHLDTVPVAQDPPSIQGGLLVGRGAADMKGALAAFAEVCAALTAAGGPRRGGILVTAYGQHEASPAGILHEPLRDLLRRGIHGDVALIGDGPNRFLPVAGKGSIIFEVHLRRAGEPGHELLSEPGTPNPVMAAHRFVELLAAQSRTWTLEDPDVGRETFFIGAIRGGDLYNRIAVEARIDGTRRYPPPRTFDEARAELDAIARRVEDEHGVEVEVVPNRSGQPFRIDPEDPFLATFRREAAHVTGTELPLAGIQLASDINHVVELTGIPTVLHGVDPTRAHATPEWVPIAELVRAARVYARVVGGMLS